MRLTTCPFFIGRAYSFSIRFLNVCLTFSDLRVSRDCRLLYLLSTIIITITSSSSLPRRCSYVPHSLTQQGGSVRAFRSHDDRPDAAVDDVRVRWQERSARLPYARMLLFDFIFCLHIQKQFYSSEIFLLFISVLFRELDRNVLFSCSFVSHARDSAHKFSIERLLYTLIPGRTHEILLQN